jgi:hypothetical protein
LLYVTAKRKVKKKIRIKYEDIYLKFSKRENEPTPNELGRRQFYEFESWGKVPENPDPYYLRLCDGRKWMDWQRNELKYSIHKFFGLEIKEQCSIEFHGWYLLREDWLGELHILKMLMNWCDFVPSWVFEE